jgi:hypothetical protein
LLLLFITQRQTPATADVSCIHEIAGLRFRDHRALRTIATPPPALRFLIASSWLRCFFSELRRTISALPSGAAVRRDGRFGVLAGEGAIGIG